MIGQMLLGDIAIPPVPACARARSRRRDPRTSHLAASGHERAGRAHSHRTTVLAVVCLNPGLTYRQIAEQCGLDPVEVMRRLNDLELAFAVEKGPETRCPLGGRRCTTWRACGMEA